MGTSVAKRTNEPTAPRVLDLESAQASRKFLDAYAGKLGQMSADQQSMFLMALGERLGVRAELGELMLFQGKPYLTLDGRLRLAHQSGLLVGVDTRPATARERRDYGAGENDTLWVCSVYRRGSGRAFVGWGHVTPADKNPVCKTHPREMAKKRAKYDALRTAFPPAEHISEMHQRYIEEAEQEIRNGQVQPHAVAMLSGYGDEDVDAGDAEGHEVAADTGDGELGLNDSRPKSSPPNAVAEGR
jgi:hypothetical protein